MRNMAFAVTGILILSIAAGCGSPDEKLRAATAAENTGNFREAAKIYSALALELAPVMKLPEAHKGKVVQPGIWQSEMEKYIAWLSDGAAPQRNNNLRSALDGLERSVQNYEQDNTGNRAATKPFDSLPTFAEHWNKAFNPPPAGTIDWAGITKRAFEKNFSIVKFSAPMNYTYDISLISRRNARRVSFMLYPESEVFIPLSPAEYAVIVKSTVEFQKGQRWISENALFDITVSDTVSLISMDLRTRVARRD